MEKEFCTYNQALRLKALGFKERVLTYYENGIPKLHNDITGWDFNTSFMTCVSRPTYSQAFRWFREKYSLIGSIDYSNRLKWYYVLREFITSDIFPNLNTSSKGEFESYEEAELACLDKLLEIVESKSE